MQQTWKKRVGKCWCIRIKIYGALAFAQPPIAWVCTTVHTVSFPFLFDLSTSFFFHYLFPLLNLTFFETENERQKTKPVPISLPRASRNLPMSNQETTFFSFCLSFSVFNNLAWLCLLGVTRKSLKGQGIIMLPCRGPQVGGGVTEYALAWRRLSSHSKETFILQQFPGRL